MQPYLLARVIFRIVVMVYIDYTAVRAAFVYMEYPSAITLAWFLFWIITAYVLSSLNWNAWRLLKKEAMLCEDHDYVNVI